MIGEKKSDEHGNEHYDKARVGKEIFAKPIFILNFIPLKGFMVTLIIYIELLEFQWC